jgi:hypothetical protein
MQLNRKVSIWKHVRLADGKWRYCRPVLDAKGKMVADMVALKTSPPLADQHLSDDSTFR